MKVKVASQDGETRPRFGPDEIVIGNFAVPQTEGVQTWRPRADDAAGKSLLDKMAKVLRESEATVE
jgi:hypothetical protein